MPRRYYYGRRYSRGSRPRRRWAPHLVQGSLSITIPAATSAGQTSVLCSNSANVGSDTPVSTIIKVKNFKVVVDLTAASQNLQLTNFIIAICYVPQGFDPGTEFLYQHPEWILVWRTVDVSQTVSNSGASLQNVQISSRLARNLNTGDSIRLFGVGTNLNTTTQGIVQLGFVCSFVTCNN